MNRAVLEAMYEYVRLHPGCSKAELRQALRLAQGELDGRLASMERASLHLCEDNGRLYPCSRRGVLSRWFLETFHENRG